MALPFQSDIKVRLPDENSQKATILLSSTGDLQLVTGQNKLAQQMFRALVNRDAYPAGQIINSRIQERELRALVNSIFRSFKNSQVDYVNQSDPDLTGYSIWRKAAGTSDNYTRISDRSVVHKFVDTDSLFNNVEYSYGISRISRNIYESKFVDIISSTPTAFTKGRIPTIGKYAIITPGNRSNTIYVDYNKRHQASELLDEILKISVRQDPTEPRKMYVGVIAKTIFGEEAAVGTIYKTKLT